VSKFTPIDDALHAYMVERGAREDEVLAAVREETAALGSVAVMQIAPDQGALMTMLMRLVRGERPGRAIEVGTFTGYSAICLARGLDEGGRLVACELDPERAKTAAKNFERAGVAERVDLRVGPAGETLLELTQQTARDGYVYDLAFIDADKTGYDSYYESCLALLRPGGMIVLDNVLQDGRVLDPGEDESAVAIDALNAKVRDDDRVEITMIGVADGLTLALKK
jgi:predicted O-methyltransferase YrrM